MRTRVGGAALRLRARRNTELQSSLRMSEGIRNRFLKAACRLVASVPYRSLLVRIEATILVEPGLRDLVKQTHCRPSRHSLPCARIGDLDEEI